MRFSLDPCAVNGELAVNAGLECDDPSVLDVANCGFAPVSSSSLLLRFLKVSFDSCPVTVSYSIDTQSSFLKLFSDSRRTISVGAVPQIVETCKLISCV